MKLTELLCQKMRKTPNDNRSLLQKLVDIAKNGFVESAVPLLASKGMSNNPLAIPYTSEAVKTDFATVRQCMASEHLNDDELAALLAVVMMKKHPKSISQLLSTNGYTTPPVDRINYLATHVSTLRSLNEFSSTGVKKYQILSCGDSRVCAKCQRHNGKKHFVDKAIIGKNAPPFCENCRCIITAEF